MPSRAMLIAQTPSGDISPFSWAWESKPASWPIRIEGLHQHFIEIILHHIYWIFFVIVKM